MDIDLKKKTLEGIEQCTNKINEAKQSIKDTRIKKHKTFFTNQLLYWKGYQDCLKALDLHLKMEDIKEWANKECKNEFKD